MITRLRQFGGSDYVFAVNDLREFGDYVGQYGLVMENGLPSKAALALRRKSGHVYDLLARREIAVAASAGQLRIPVDMGPCEGRVFMVTDQAITGVGVKAAATAKLGGSVSCDVVVAGADGRPMDAVVPLKLDILDPSGRAAEFSGYYGAVGGRVTVKLDLARNDSPGLWQIRATELASGLTASHYLRVSR
ncbi:MAG: hypothetical protein HYZ36_03910 [Pedosphaera parvula]|nr:hypothetical protein [Pedosphaera parvula]